MKRVHLLVAGFAMLALAGCKGNESASATTAAEPAVVTVGPENVTVAVLTDLRSGPAVSGALEAERAATVRAEVSGPVVRTLAEAGQRVKRGALLARLDDTAVRDAYLSARSAVRSAEAALELAKRNAGRSERLASAGAVAERDLEASRYQATNAEGALADARARLALAQEQLQNTEVRAPLDGIVSERQADAGDVVQPGDALFTVVDPTSLRLAANVPVDAIGSLEVGTPVEFTVSGFDRRFSGRIQRINPVLDPATRQVRIYVSVPNREQTLVSGLFAEGRVATDIKRAVAVPVGAIDTRGTRPTVHQVKAGKVVASAVQVGVRDEVTDMVEVQSGVAEGDTLLLGSAQGVTPGTPVRVLQEGAGR
ncbi:MAG: efflux RND transporter periplasmic adaptor subunit [Gemmatimonadales bacterium]|nr:efflux RND transporter periplasmic adaptor subunit [Gemmatimonadales bacterium]